MDHTSDSSYKVYLFIIFAMLFWSMSYIWSTIVFRYYSPVATIFLRLLISSLLLFLFLKLSGKLERIKKKDYKLFFLSAFFNPFLYFIGENYGLKNSSASIAAVIISTIPLFTPMAAWFAIREKLHWLNILGIMVSFTGIIIMLVNKDMSINIAPVGIIFLLLAVASAVTYSIFLKKLTEKYSPINIIAYQNLIGLTYFLPFFILFDLHEVLSVSLNAELLFSLLMLALFASSLAFIFYAYIINNMN